VAKRKGTSAGSAVIRKWTAKEKQALQRKRERREDRLRKKYRLVRGKKVDFITHSSEQGTLYFTVRFMDKTALHLQVRPELALESLKLSDWTTGDDKVLKTYYPNLTNC